MSSNIDYSFVKNDQGTITMRSTVKSFGLDSVTEKDFSSFYTKFSSYSYFDTGLLPVDGTGILSIRKAAEHTQFTYQIKPGAYHINWGSYEGDHDAVSYYLAQPYRIIIADIVNDNLLGARTFYSPYPITHHDMPLYHVNLPNINCKGYRGNGVGWICLYHTHDISEYSFNEKVSHIIQRCSGVETYNDQNMSETDGPRFYQSHYSDNSNYSFLWDPNAWQNKTSDEGWEWTLDPDLWIPILVSDIDSQEAHDPNGTQFTLYMAMLGNYKAYYTDPLVPKPVNAIARNIDLNSKSLYTAFIKSYNSSSNTSSTVNPYQDSSSIRLQLSDLKVQSLSTSNHSDEDGPDPNYFICPSCKDQTHYDYASTYDGIYYCDNCFSENYIYLELSDEYVPADKPTIFYSNELDIFIDKDEVNPEEIVTCPSCQHPHFFSDEYHLSFEQVLIYPPLDNSSHLPVCSNCNTHPHVSCYSCSRLLPDPSLYQLYSVNSFQDQNSIQVYVCNSCYFSQYTSVYKNNNTTFPTNAPCICGEIPSSFQKVSDSYLYGYIQLHMSEEEYIERNSSVFQSPLTYKQYQSLYIDILTTKSLFPDTQKYKKALSQIKGVNFDSLPRITLDLKIHCPECSYISSAVDYVEQSINSTESIHGFYNKHAISDSILKSFLNSYSNYHLNSSLQGTDSTYIDFLSSTPSIMFKL